MVMWYVLVPLTTALQWRHNGHNSQPYDSLLNRLFRRRSTKTSKLRGTGLCAGNSLGTSGFPAHMASNAEDVSIWWRHHWSNALFVTHFITYRSYDGSVFVIWLVFMAAAVDTEMGLTSCSIKWARLWNEYFTTVNADLHKKCHSSKGNKMLHRQIRIISVKKDN